MTNVVHVLLNAQIGGVGAAVSASSSINYSQLLAAAVLGVIMSALTTLLIFPTLQSKVDSIMVDKFGSFSFRKKRKLSGVWNRQWHHQSASYPNPSIALGVEIKHYRNLVKAKIK